MLSILIELVVSVALCAALVFFAFLNAPAEAGANSEDDGAANTADDLYEPALLPTRELPLYTVLARYLTLTEGSPCGMVYRWVLINALHYSARELYSEAHLREWNSGVGDSDDPSSSSRSGGNTTKDEEVEGRDRSGMTHGAETPSPSSSPLPAGVGARRLRRRHRRGGPPALAAAPTPLRHESAHWVNVLLRCAAFLCLGGGTVKPEVWTDHLLYHTEKVLNSVNAAYAAKMHARAMLTRVVASQLMSNSSVAGPSHNAGHGQGNSFVPFTTMQQQQQRFVASPATMPFGAQKALMCVQLLELGAGLLGGPSREVRRPRLNTADVLGSSSGKAGIDAAGSAGAALSGGAKALNSPSAAAAAAAFATTTNTAAASNSAASVGSTSPPLAATHPSLPSSHNSAIAAASVLLSTSMAGISSMLTDVVSSVTTAHGGAADRVKASNSVNGGGNTAEAMSVAGEYMSAAPVSGGGGGAQLGVVLPRIEGDVISVEQPYSPEGEAPAVPVTAAPTDAAGASPNRKASVNIDNNNSTSNSTSSNSGSHAKPTTTLSTPLPVSLPLRCFAIPLLYEDQRFHLRLGCSLPLGALLPVSLCVPPDVLTLDCAVAVRRIIFNGHLYAAFHGSHVEVSFPVAPQFTAVVEVMPDYSGSRGHGAGSSSSGHQTPVGYNSSNTSPAMMQHLYHSAAPYGFASPSSSSAGAAVGAARTLGHTFTAVNTTRNEITNLHDPATREASPSARPPLPPSTTSSASAAAAVPPTAFAGRGGAGGFHSMHHVGAHGAGGPLSSATTGTSSINERNEKVQEVVLLAVRRVIQSLTYPNVLAGQLVCSGKAGGGGSGGDVSGGPGGSTFEMRWKRTTASLPLRM